MAKNTSILLGDHFDKLVRELKKGEKSGFVRKFDRKNFIKNLHGKYLTK